MPDEIGTKTTRSDTPSPDDSLFGDAADDTAAAVVEEQDATREAEQDPQGSDDAEGQDGPPEDLKVVVSIKGGRATIGVQQPSRADAGSIGGGRKGESQVRRRPQASGSRQTRSPG